MYNDDDEEVSSCSTTSSTCTVLADQLVLEFFSVNYHIPLVRRTSRTTGKTKIYYPVRTLPIRILDYMLGDPTVHYPEMDNIELISLRHLILHKYRGPQNLYDSIVLADVVLQNICNFSTPCQLHRIVHSSQVNISIEAY